MGDTARLLSTVADPHPRGARSSIFEALVLPAPRHQRDGDAAVVTLAGELDAYTAHLVEPELRSFIEYAGHVIVDLSDVTFIDVAGVRLLHRLATGPQVVRLDNVPARVARTFGLAGLGSLVARPPLAAGTDVSSEHGHLLNGRTTLVADPGHIVRERGGGDLRVDG